MAQAQMNVEKQYGKEVAQCFKEIMEQDRYPISKQILQQIKGITDKFVEEHGSSPTAVGKLADALLKKFKESDSNQQEIIKNALASLGRSLVEGDDKVRAEIVKRGIIAPGRLSAGLDMKHSDREADYLLDGTMVKDIRCDVSLVQIRRGYLTAPQVEDKINSILSEYMEKTYSVTHDTPIVIKMVDGRTRTGEIGKFVDELMQGKKGVDVNGDVESINRLPDFTSDECMVLCSDKKTLDSSWKKIASVYRYRTGENEEIFVSTSFDVADGIKGIVSALAWGHKDSEELLNPGRKYDPAADLQWEEMLDKRYGTLAGLHGELKKVVDFREFSTVSAEFIHHEWRCRDFVSRVGEFSDSLLNWERKEALPKLTGMLSLNNSGVRMGISEGRKQPGMEKSTADLFEEADSIRWSKSVDEFLEQDLLSKDPMKVAGTITKIRHGGFSFVDVEELMEKLLDKYHRATGDEAINLGNMIRAINTNLASEYVELQGKLESQTSFRNMNLL